MENVFPSPRHGSDLGRCVPDTPPALGTLGSPFRRLAPSPRWFAFRVALPTSRGARETGKRYSVRSAGGKATAVGRGFESGGGHSGQRPRPPSPLCPLSRRFRSCPASRVLTALRSGWRGSPGHSRTSFPFQCAPVSLGPGLLRGSRRKAGLRASLRPPRRGEEPFSLHPGPLSFPPGERTAAAGSGR